MDDEEYRKLPIDERCVHKLWKARVNGYEEVTKLFRQIDDEKSPEFSKYLGLVKKFVIDSNVVGQEKGLEATLAYVENYAHAGKTVNEVMGGVVTKCMGAPKARTRELALQLTLMYIEIEKYEAVQEELIKGMDQKNPKIVAACISACTIALKEFGSKIINVKPLIKKITPLFADRDKGVRDEARAMVVEIYRWIGPAIKSQLNGLQSVQITELEAEFAKIDGQKAVPLRYIRSQQQKQAILATEANNVDGEDSEVGEEDVETPEAMDPYDLADPVDILSKLPKDFYDKLEEKKWQERKDALEALENLLKTPKLENGDYGDLVRALKKVIQKDSNVICVASAGRCIAGLANGLKKRFHTYSGTLIAPLLEKFKERKQNVVTAIKDAIDAVYLTTNLEAISEDAIEALGNKNPSVKAETALFLARAFTKTSPTAINKKLLKSLTTSLTKLINEPDPTVRDSGAEAIGTLMKLTGEKAIAPFLVEVEKDNLKMTKIKEFCDKATIKSIPLTGKKERSKPAATKSQPSAAQPSKTSEGPAPTPRKLAPSRPGTSKKKATEISSGTATIVKSKQTSKTPKAIIEKELCDEEVDEKITNILSSNIMTDLQSPNWKVRLEAAEKFLTDIQAIDSKELPTQALLKALSRKPGLKEINFQVLKAKLDIVKYLADNCQFSTTSANICLIEICEKFGDVKNGQIASTTMTSIAETTNLNFISTTIIEFAFNQQKNPKVQSEVLLWLSNAIKEFGFNNINAKLLIDCGKKGLSSTNPNVRQATIQFFGILYLYMGATLHIFFENEKPALRDLINAEFDKYEGETPPTPIRGVVKSSQSSNSLDGLDQDDAENEPQQQQQQQQPQLQDLFPRIDISNQITEALINELEDKNWKVRIEALTKVSQIIADAKLIKPNIGDLPLALVHRLGDSNTKIAQTALNICEAIAKAMGPPAKQFIKQFLPLFFKNLSDSKDWMRKKAIETINAYVESCGYKEMFENEMIADALRSGSPSLRIELWNWLSIHLPKVQTKVLPKEELLVCLPILYSNLEDRNVDVRKYATEAIYGFMLHLSYETMIKQTEKLKTVSRTNIIASLDKIRPNLPVKPLPTTNKKNEETKTVRGGGKAAVTKQNSVKQKPSSAKVVQSTSSTTSRNKKDEDIDTSPLLTVNNWKNQRAIDESKLKVLKWNFTTPREEFVELLKDQMNSANVNKTLMANMFHMDFRYHIKAIESLMDDLPNNGQALISNLDLILKWLTLRFFDTNPSVLLKGLEYLQAVLNMLIESNYRMLEYEATSFIPYLVIKIGDPKDSVRNGVRSLLRQIYYVYPISRVFTYVMEGIKSKNARLRAECLDLLGAIISEYGVTICTPSPSVCLKEIAKQISDRDNGVRNAALNCIGAAYEIMGDKVYKKLGNISDKDLSLLEERIKRLKKANSNKVLKSPHKDQPIPIDLPPCEEPSPQLQQQQQQQHQNGGGTNEIIDDEDYDDDDDDGDNLPVLPTQIKDEIIKKEQINGPYKLDQELLDELDNMVQSPPEMKPIEQIDLEFIYEDVRIPRVPDANAKMLHLSPPKPVDSKFSKSLLLNQSRNEQQKQNELFEQFNKIQSTHDINDIIDGLQQLQDILKSPVKSQIIEYYENELLSSIVKQLRFLKAAYEFDSDLIKILRHIFITTDLFFNIKGLGQNVEKNVIKDLMDEYILLLAGDKLEKCPDGLQYVKVVNVQCVKSIEKFNHTSVICAVVNLLNECIRNESLESRHTELIMKSMWRIIKIMPNWVHDLDYDSILLEIHNLLKEFPTQWWKNQTSDTPIRTVKTILHAIVKIKGGTIFEHLTKIPNKNESELESYLLKLLKTLKIDDVPKKSSGITSTSSSGTNLTPTTVSRLIHNLLTEIFQKIGKKEESKDTLNLLYDLLQKYKNEIDDLEPYLKDSAPCLKDYIRNGLKEIENERKSTGKDENNEPTTNEHSAAYWRQRLENLKKMLNTEE